MTVYDNKFSQYYDLIFKQKKYNDEVEFLKKEGVFGENLHILDVGCGTGSHSIILAQRPEIKYVIGIDDSSHMIKMANAKKGGLENLSFRTQRLRDVNETSFDLVISMFNVINHILTIEKLGRFFCEIKQKIKPGGFFIFDCWNGVATHKNLPTKERKLRYNRDSKSVITYCNPEVNLMNSLITMHNEVEIFEHKNIIDSFSYVLQHKMWMPHLISELLSSAGFAEIKLNKFFVSKRADATDYKIVYVCKAQEETSS